MSQFGKLMKAFRIKDGLTLQHMAKKIGSHKGYVSGIENDKVSPPSIKLLVKYHRIFQHHGIELPDLVEMAYVTKAPKSIRDRLEADVARRNPLYRFEVIVVPGKPAQPAEPDKVEIKAPGAKAAV